MRAMQDHYTRKRTRESAKSWAQEYYMPLDSDRCNLGI